MSRIAEKVDYLRRKKEKALIVYLTAGDPSLAITKNIIFSLEKSGVDILEIGVPFSDPTADGPVIQAASQRALKNGTTLKGVLKLVEEVRQVSQIPIVLFGYFNPIFAYGVKKFSLDAKSAGVDGILVVDLPPEEAQELRCYTDPAGIDFISLIAPTTGPERRQQIAAAATGFLYYISITGITGTVVPKISDIKTAVEKIRKIIPPQRDVACQKGVSNDRRSGSTKLPIVVGFGISQPQQAGEIAQFADGVVIGSAVVRLIDENSTNSNLEKIVADYVGEIKRAIC
jgi:tryptophan synthase alpha chain